MSLLAAEYQQRRKRLIIPHVRTSIAVISEETIHLIRYYLALVLFVSFPPLLSFWLLVHPFVRFWRKLGPVWTYTIVGLIVLFEVLLLFAIRKRVLFIEFGTNRFLIVVGLFCLLGASRLRVLISRHVTNALLLGLHEIGPEEYPGQLVDAGLYGRIRHPRYVQIALALLGYSLVTNYLALYIIFAICVAELYLIVLLEEKELWSRFGMEYEEYCHRVPRFMPRLRKRASK